MAKSKSKPGDKPKSIPRVPPPAYKPGLPTAEYPGAGVPDPVPTDPMATLHRANDAPALGRWLRSLQNLLPALTSADQLNLAAIGAGMSVWQRETVLKILTDTVGRR